MSDSPPDGHLSADIRFQLGERTVNLQVQVPTMPIGPTRLLPLVHALTDMAVDAAVQASSEPIRCGPGCGACCRQLVPVSRTEARALHALVQAMPAPQRESVRARFDAAIERLAQAGLLERLRDFMSLSSADRTEVGLAYFRVGLPCPFLVDDSCSVYTDRPVICREFLVTSDPRHCEDPSPQTTRRVHLDTRISLGLAALDGVPAPDAPTRWIALPLALEWAETQPDEAVRDGRQMLEAFVGRVSNT